MPAIYRHRKVSLKRSPHYGLVERWEPTISKGQYILAHRSGPERNMEQNVKLVPTVEAAIQFLGTGQYCIRMTGALTKKDTLLIPESVIIEQ